MTDRIFDRDQEKRLLDKLRGVAERLNGDVWEMDVDASGIHIIAKRATGEEVRIVTLHPECLPDEQDLVAGALDHLFLFNGLVWRAMETVRDLRAQIARLVATPRAKDNFGFQAKSLCEKRGFWRFLEGKGPGGVIASAQAAETRMKGLIGIRSKAELNDDAVKRGIFLKLRKDYYDSTRGRAA